MNPSFFQKLQTAIERESPFVLYRLPGETHVHLNVQDNSDKNRFLLHSFDSQTEKQVCDENPLQIAQHEFSFHSDLFLVPAKDSEPVTQQDYEKLIRKTIQEIRHSSIQKIVISRQKIVENRNFNLFRTFRNLLDQHPRALVYLWHQPDEEIWIGATPELLLNQTGNQIKTVSLAGTKLPENNWTQKEIDEQQFVTDFIADHFAGLIHLKISDPETIQAGKFQHLKTYISAEVPLDFDLEKLLNNLHPTPAVCGLPKKAAFDFILQNEGYDRGFYSGYIGIEKENSKSYFVNLRCAQFFNNKIEIYVGGGITADSDPVKEWKETELKSGTIRNALS